MGFEVGGSEIAEDRMPAPRVVISEIVADFQPRLGQVAEAGTGEQLSFEAASKLLGVGVIVAVDAPAHTLHSLVAGYQGLKVGGCILDALVRVDDESRRRMAYS